jgi:menaquinol-cytochrome c reductase cytochrome b/c subunit
MATNRIEERRAQHAKYKQDVAERGKPFYPFAMFHDTVMSLVVVVVIVALAVIWKWDAEHNGGGTHAGLLGPLYTDQADPATTSFVPRPDWYFYFLFYLLRIFKWPDSVILGTVGIPTICLILLLALPFVDIRRERRLLRRPVAVVAAILVVLSMGVLTWKGATAKESLGSEVLAAVPQWAAKQAFASNQTAVAGAKIFAQVGCLNCHSYLNTGGGFAGAPDLTDEGSKNKGIKFQVDHLKCPSCVNPGSPMPSFQGLGDANLRRVAVFLEASKGGK